MIEARHIETYSIIKMQDGKPARFIRKRLEAQYIGNDGELIGRKVKATDKFEVLQYPANISYNALVLANAAQNSLP